MYADSIEPNHLHRDNSKAYMVQQGCLGYRSSLQRACFYLLETSKGKSKRARALLQYYHRGRLRSTLCLLVDALEMALNARTQIPTEEDSRGSFARTHARTHANWNSLL